MNSVKFYITPVYPYGNDHYYHEIIVLAEGFRDLGFEVFGNTDYWFQPEKNEYLINGDINSKADIEIYDSRYIKSFAHLLFKKGHKAFNLDAINVLVDRNSWISPDWMIDDNYSIFDIILAGNLLHNVSYPKNVYPSAIGITYRQMEYIDRFTDPCSPESIIAYNFRVQHNLRKLILDNLKKRNNEICYPLHAKFREYNSNDQYSSSIDQFYWEKTTRRHNTEYFKLINQSILFFSVGGYFEFKPVLFQPYSLIDKFRRKPFYLLYKYLTRIEKDISNSIYIFQYDSFRMWETFYSKTAPILLDFDFWNFNLPVKPIEGKHYVGIYDLSLNKFIENIKSKNKDEIKQIGENGREFVIQNYSPKATTRRLLTYIHNK